MCAAFTHCGVRQVDLNAPLSKDSPPAVTDVTRLSAACPTIHFLADKGAKVILASHLGRPKKKVVDGLRMGPVAAKLSELLGKEVRVRRFFFSSDGLI